MRHSRGAFVLVAATLLIISGSAPAQTYIKIPAFGGGVMASDNKTLIVSLSTAGMLGYYYDSAT